MQRTHSGIFIPVPTAHPSHAAGGFLPCVTPYLILTSSTFFFRTWRASELSGCSSTACRFFINTSLLRHRLSSSGDRKGTVSPMLLAVTGSDSQPEGKEWCQAEEVCPVCPLPTWPCSCHRAQRPLDEPWSPIHGGASFAVVP